MAHYQVIARKWRPALFDEIVGQGHVTRTLKNAIASGRIAHAYLFSGPRGVGKTTAARILAKCLNCANGPTVTPCNSCDSCKAIAAGNAIDVFEIDGASNNSVESVRELREAVRYVPSQGKYRVYIIDEVHMLTTPAFNALLKTLEEPPPHVVFIFATTEIHKIPLTIVSRCQRFDFKRIPFKEIYLRLRTIVTEEGIKFEDDALYTLSREADGSLRDGQSLLEQVAAFGAGDVSSAHVTEALGLMDRTIIYGLAEALTERDGARCLNIVEKIYGFGYDLKRGCADLLENLRDLAVVKITGDSATLNLPDAEIDRLKTLASKAGVERLMMLFSVMSKGYEEVARSFSPRHSFEMALLRAAHLEDAAPVGEILDRLNELKRGVVSSSVPPSGGQAARSNPSVAIAGAPKAVSFQQAQHKPESAGAVQKSGREAEGFLEFVTAKDPACVESLRGAAAVESEGGVEITVIQGKANFLENVKKTVLDALAAEYFGRRMRVVIKHSALPNGIISPVSAPNGRGQQEVGPVVGDALRIFGGKLIEGRRRGNV
ncbi:MAG: DNA polymerase III subunit gamma/tau [Deltaproteobacteria bacterium]|nr:DNA polymerase III subunit gamma/tau [Deltaproteobacteria bacterium]